MEALQVPHLTRSSLHQLTNLSLFAGTSLLSLLRTRRASTEFRIKHGSYLSLRTFYAFGARSGRTPSLQRSSSYNAFTSSLAAEPLLQSTATNNALRRSSTTALLQKLKHSIAYYGRYLTPISESPKAYSNSLTQNHICFYSSSSQVNRDYRYYQSSRTGQFFPTRIQRSTSKVATQYSVDAKSFSYLSEKSSRLQYKRPVKNADTLKKKDETPAVKEDSVKIATLTEKNESLESELERLRFRLIEKERSERELRRKMLKYAAEVKMWKEKCEMKQTARNEICKSKSNEEEISDIMEQLNNAAEKLTRLNAVKDLKLLQSEMETALKEISK